MVRRRLLSAHKRISPELTASSFRGFLCLGAENGLDPDINVLRLAIVYPGWTCMIRRQRDGKEMSKRLSNTIISLACYHD